MKISKDTKVCISISQNPGNTGTRIQNSLYRKHDLDFIYKSFKVDDIRGAIEGVRSLGIRGCSVSMPFKNSVIKYLDKVSHRASQIGSVNTIVNNNGFLQGYNTDASGAERALSDSNIKVDTAVIYGAGCTGSSVAYSLSQLGVNKVFIFNRTKSKSEKLAKNLLELGIYSKSIDAIAGFNESIFINCSSVGMSIEDVFPVQDKELLKFSLIFDVVPKDTNLIKRARALNIPIITGMEMAINQSLFQFELYTEKKVKFDEEKLFVKEILCQKV
jgi:shikimate dehydrogenase